MSKRILITFSGDRYHDTTKKIIEDGPRLGASEVRVYDDVWLKEKRPEFCAATKWAFDHPKVRGVNWFCFKPFVVLDALNRCDDGDIILFVDADTWPISDMSPIFDIAEKDGMALFAACGHLQRHWSKRDAQILMGMDDDKWRDKQAGVARFMAFKKGCVVNGSFPLFGMTDVYLYTNEFFVDDWLRYTCDERANTFDPSVLAPEYPDLKEGRAEQAVLTNLAHKYNIPLHREADQWGNAFVNDFPNDTYSQIFESTGVYSYAPGPRKPGSAFRNVED